MHMSMQGDFMWIITEMLFGSWLKLQGSARKHEKCKKTDKNARKDIPWAYDCGSRVSDATIVARMIDNSMMCFWLVGCERREEVIRK